jgi:hypothetical protein
MFVWQVVNDWRRGWSSVFLTLFVVPSVLVGIATLLVVLHQLLAMLNPRITLALSHGGSGGASNSRKAGAPRRAGARLILEAASHPPSNDM